MRRAFVVGLVFLTCALVVPSALASGPRTRAAAVRNVPAEGGATEARARLTIKASEARGVVAMGRFRPRRSPTLRSAIRAFGRSSSRHLRQGACRVRWRRLGLIIQFANFGGHQHTTCDADVGLAQSATIKGHRVRRWRTGRGLRGGDSRDDLLDLYPDAEQHGRRWWIVSADSPF